MTAKEYLNQTYRLNELIRSNIREVSRLRRMIGSTGSPGTDGTSGSPNAGNASFTRLIERIAELETKIDSEIDEMISVQEEVREVINAVPDLNERLLLRLRYIEHYSWTKIADKMKYSERRIYAIHEQALKKIVVPDKECSKFQ